MPVARTMFHIEEEKVEKAFRTDFVQTILVGTLQTSSSLSKLNGLPGALEMIHEFAFPVVEKDTFRYKVKMPICLRSGTQDVVVEALEQTHCFEENDGKVAFIETGRFRKPGKNFFSIYAWSKNVDGSFFNEAQLRQLWQHIAVRSCRNRERCQGSCCALPGDTIFHSPYDVPYSYKIESATQEELEERGILGSFGSFPHFENMAWMVREFGEDSLYWYSS